MYMISKNLGTEVDISGWLDAFAAHPQIGDGKSLKGRWSKGEQSAALSTATDSTLQELVDWNQNTRKNLGSSF
jgi:5-hydroxyisourate hydrolase/2-oxo-4-hydroxy-4-carboxy-5-ureidoimidazoline decarboxylase